MWKLDLNQIDKLQKTYCGKLNAERCYTCTCMVDKDRFIAILGGSNDAGFYSYGDECSNKAQLYALNSNKIISIKDTIFQTYGRSSKSLYHDNFHKIVVCDDRGRIEWHDINQDKWIKE